MLQSISDLVYPRDEVKFVKQMHHKVSYYERNQIFEKKRYCAEGNFVKKSRFDWRASVDHWRKFARLERNAPPHVNMLDEALALRRRRGTQQPTSAQGRPLGQSGRGAGAERHSVFISLRGGLQRQRSCADPWPNRTVFDSRPGRLRLRSARRHQTQYSTTLGSVIPASELIGLWSSVSLPIGPNI